jgi:imidazole glycerol-phosphate synthase subunit HisH
MLAVIDYGVGNLRNVVMAFRRLGLDAAVISEPREVRRAAALVLPGVGAFGDSIGSLRALGLEEDLVAAIRDGLPFLGICVGLQLLFEASEEMGEHRGLGVLGGRVRRFPTGLSVPHMGWNEIHQAGDLPYWKDLPDHSHAYFVHSYYADPSDPRVVAATTDYGITYTSAVALGNLFAIQFHPEKSQDVGERILRNYCRVAGLLGEGV